MITLLWWLMIFFVICGIAGIIIGWLYVELKLEMYNPDRIEKIVLLLLAGGWIGFIASLIIREILKVG